MRIDQISSAGMVRPRSATEPVRPAGRSISGPAPSGSQRETSLTRLTNAADLAALPRFAMLKGLMERLTGREVTLVPPATMMLGARNTPPPPSGIPDDRPAPEVHLTSVDTVEDGRSFRFGVSSVAPGGGRVAAQIDVERQVMDLQAGRPRGRQEPLHIEVDSSALEPALDEPMRVAVSGVDTVRVTVDRPHLDLDA